MDKILSEKFQCLSADQIDCITTMDQERVYSVNRIAPDPYADNWNGSPAIHKKFRLMKQVYERFRSPDAFDFSVHIGDSVKHCCILVLQSYSKFFRKQSRHEKMAILDDSRITPEVFQKIYDWMVDSSKTVDREGLIDLLIGAQYLKVELLLQQIWHQIQDGEKFQEAEAFLLYLEAKQSNCEKVQNMMIARVQQFFMIVVCSEEFLKMDLSEIVNWLKLDSIAVNSEVDVFFSAARWLLHDWEARKDHVGGVMINVRFGLDEPWRICEFRLNKNEGKLKKILENSELQKMLESSLSYSTYRKCFQDESCEQFQDFLTRFELKRLFPRETPKFDWQSKYMGSAYTFERFEECLKDLRSCAFSSWSKILQNKN